MRRPPISASWLAVMLWAALAGIWSVQPADAAVVTLKNGMILEGVPGKIAGMGENPLKPDNPAGEVKVRLIVLVDDGLRRTYFSTYQVQELQESAATVVERIKIQRRVADEHGYRISRIGPILRVEPFDQWGRRIFSMDSTRGRIDVIQGITEVTPVWTKVEGLLGSTPYIWDMRIATSSIPRETLSKVLLNEIDKKNPDDRLKIVRLYLQSERYSDAQAELESVIKEFPELRDLQKEVKALRQLSATRLIRELEMRRAAGQHGLAYRMLSNFPSDGVAGETLLKVREILGTYKTATEQRDRLLSLMETHLAAVKDEGLKPRIEEIRLEVANELNLNTIDRMADYLRLADDEKLMAEQKLSLAITGWMLGTGAGTENLAVGLSLVEVRRLVRLYLQSDNAADRRRILEQLHSLEGATPGYIARLIEHMKPPVETAPQRIGADGEPLPAPEENPLDPLKFVAPENRQQPAADAQPAPQPVPDFFKLTTKGLTGGADISYLVQLPVEYDPYRKYPTVVTLHGAGTPAAVQVDWWSGGYNPRMQMRMGQGARHGYIVIAPLWTAPHQIEYRYSAQEHAAVLNSLRDACRRFSVDTDRVYLSGHSMGGDAAWDIGLAHPDLWAGVIPIVAKADKYVARYWENATNVPFYFITGELDGDKVEVNARDMDRYMKKPGIDVMVTEYMGRGHEHFIDEIQRVFEWMRLHRRNFYPQEFSVVSMRTWDNFFWWAELDQYPSRSMVSPISWPQAGARPATTEGNFYGKNKLSLRTAADAVTILLSPDLVDFNERISISVNGRSKTVAVEPQIEVLLEDARTRCDRLHPFWAKYNAASGRAGG